MIILSDLANSPEFCRRFNSTFNDLLRWDENIIFVNFAFPNQFQDIIDQQVKYGPFKSLISLAEHLNCLFIDFKAPSDTSRIVSFIKGSIRTSRLNLVLKPVI